MEGGRRARREHRRRARRARRLTRLVILGAGGIALGTAVIDIASQVEPIGGWIADGTIARAAAIVVHRGQVIGERWWGDATDGSPIDARTLLPFASLTKPALATAVLRLVSRGVMALSNRIGDVLPDAPVAVRSITVAQLLTHSGGFPEHVPGVEALQARGAAVGEYVRAALGATLLFEPGTRVLYSNAGFQVLGAMVERAAGASVADVLERETFAPVGMPGATLRPLSRPGARVARVEIAGARSADPAHELYNSAYFKRLGRADAGLFATPRDVALLLEMYRLGGRGVLPAELAAEAILSQTHGIPGRYGAYEWESCDFGWGWEIKNGKQPHPTGARTSARTFGHLGGSGALAFCDPERELTVVIHTLRDFSDGWATGRPYLSRVATGLVGAVDGGG